MKIVKIYTAKGLEQEIEVGNPLTYIKVDGRIIYQNSIKRKRRRCRENYHNFTLTTDECEYKHCKKCGVCQCENLNCGQIIVEVCCPNCDGKGSFPDHPIECVRCKGTGKITEVMK